MIHSRSSMAEEWQVALNQQQVTCDSAVNRRYSVSCGIYHHIAAHWCMKIMGQYYHHYNIILIIPDGADWSSHRFQAADFTWVFHEWAVAWREKSQLPQSTASLDKFDEAPSLIFLITHWMIMMIKIVQGYLIWCLNEYFVGIQMDTNLLVKIKLFS